MLIFWNQRYAHQSFDYIDYGKLFTGRNPYADLLMEGSNLHHGLLRLAAYPYVALIMMLVLCVIPQKRILPFSVWGSRTLQVYFIHRFVIYVLMFFGFQTYIVHTFGYGLTGVGILVLSGIALTAILSLKIFSYPFTAIMNCKFKWILTPLRKVGSSEKNGDR